jgi:hypothetical protein
MKAAMIMETTRAEPACPAAMPMTTKMPAPTMAPTLIAVASNKLRDGLSSACAASFFIAKPVKDVLKDLCF